MDKVTAIVLAGGKGTRIAGLFPNIPKPMIPVRGEPFLHWVAQWLSRRGVGDILLSIGHMAGQIEAWAAGRPGGLALRTVMERAPLGTGGAVVSCLDLCGDWVLVLNGDSLLEVDVAGLVRRVRDAGLDGAIVGIAVDDTSRYGSLAVDGEGRLAGFFEKRPGRGLINGGIYLFRKDLLAGFAVGTALSMETDVIPSLLAGGARLAVEVSPGPFLDIGTPESVVQAEAFIARLLRLA